MQAVLVSKPPGTTGNMDLFFFLRKGNMDVVLLDKTDKPLLVSHCVVTVKATISMCFCYPTKPLLSHRVMNLLFVCVM
jgi:hypothetical protein